jgi:type IV pilus assembly protein PilO
MKASNLTQAKLPVFQTLASDFRTLDWKDPGLWPPLPRAIILVGILLFALLVGWWFGWQAEFAELDAKAEQEVTLKKEWETKKTQAVNLDEHRNRLTEINHSFGALLKQLPDSSEMDSLLVDLNQAGLGRGLQFELFKPGGEQLRDFYAELPITIRVMGSYHDLGAFAGDVAKLPRIVTFNDIDITVKDGSTLAMAVVAKTFRYLDEAEVTQQKKEKSTKTKGGGK